MNARPQYQKSFRLLLAAVIIAMLFSSTNALAAAGALDPAFGTNGTVVTKFNDLPSMVREIALQSDGKIIVLGTMQLNAEQTQKILTRYNSNGTLDTTFGVNGMRVVEVDTFSASRLALQPDGKLIVGGLSGSALAVVRYLSNGTLDTTFGTNGLGVLNWSTESRGYPADMTIQTDGKIVMAGDHTAGQSNFTDFFAARFNANGTADETFVAHGYNILDRSFFPNNRYNYGKSVIVQPDGKIVISGYMMDNDGKNQLSMIRLNANGSGDATFGTSGNGAFVTSVTGFSNSSGALVRQTDGKIIVAGSIFQGGSVTTDNLGLVRYNSNGKLDTSFGGTGIVSTDFGNNETVDDLVIQTDGKIIVIGKGSTSLSNDFLLVRYNINGTVDTTFGTNGKLTTDFGDTEDIATASAIQPDNKVIIAGNSVDKAVLARYATATITQNSVTFKSVSAYDGLILESAETSNVGGSMDKTSTVINIGDDAKDRQYRGVLSFNTASLPDNALVTSAQVKIKRQGFVGTDAFTTHGSLVFDIRSGAFTNNVALTLDDFAAASSAGSQQGSFSEAAVNWYAASLNSLNLGYINKYGVTQFRLSFTKDDNDNMGADYIKFFSGSSTTANQPQLIITYTTTSGGVEVNGLSVEGMSINNQPPVITSDGGLPVAEITLVENTITVTTVTAVDAQQPALTYSILGGEDAALFTIDPSTGELSFVTAPSYNVPDDAGSDHSYRVTVQASDGELTTLQDILVTIVPAVP